MLNRLCCGISVFRSVLRGVGPPRLGPFAQAWGGMLRLPLAESARVINGFKASHPPRWLRRFYAALIALYFQRFARGHRHWGSFCPSSAICIRPPLGAATWIVPQRQRFGLVVCCSGTLRGGAGSRLPFADSSVYLSRILALSSLLVGGRLAICSTDVMTLLTGLPAVVLRDDRDQGLYACGSLMAIDERRGIGPCGFLRRATVGVLIRRQLC